MADDKPTQGEGGSGVDEAHPGEGGEHAPPGEEGEMTFEPSADGMLLTEENMAKLEEQLKVMEEEQSQLAAKIQQANETQQLDEHLAEIDEQFRRSFEDRFSAPSSRGGRPTSFISHFDSGAGVEIDLMKLNAIFRDVSRDLGDAWQPVFEDLVRKFPPEQVSVELEKIQQMQPLVRGYRSLNVWKELSGAEFNVRDLIDALRKNDHNDIADVTAATIEGTADTSAKSKPVSRRKSDVTRGRSVLDNRRMLLLAKKIGGDWEGLGKALGLPDEELAEIKEDPDSGTYQGAFKMLWAWRQTQPDIEQESSIEALKNALKQTNRQTLADEITSL